MRSLAELLAIGNYRFSESTLKILHEWEQASSDKVQRATFPSRLKAMKFHADDFSAQDSAFVSVIFNCSVSGYVDKQRALEDCLLSFYNTCTVAVEEHSAHVL